MEFVHLFRLHSSGMNFMHFVHVRLLQNAGDELVPLCLIQRSLCTSACSKARERSLWSLCTCACCTAREGSLCICARVPAPKRGRGVCAVPDPKPGRGVCALAPAPKPRKRVCALGPVPKSGGWGGLMQSPIAGTWKASRPELDGILSQ